MRQVDQLELGVGVWHLPFELRSDGWGASASISLLSLVKSAGPGASLEAWWLRIHLPMQEMRVPSLMEQLTHASPPLKLFLGFSCIPGPRLSSLKAGDLGVA